MNSSVLAAAGLIAAGLLCGGPGVSRAFAQAPAGGTSTEKPLPPISLDLRDAPIRAALEQLFGNAGVQFSIDNSVAGFVTLKIVDQPFENALKVLLRSSSTPLSYTRENNVFFIKPRLLTSTTEITPPPVDQNNSGDTKEDFRYQVVQLTYIDPYDLRALIPKLQVIAGSLRQQQSGGSGSGSLGGSSGGLGGGLGGSSGGLGGGLGGSSGGLGGSIGGSSGGLGGGISSGGVGGSSGGLGGRIGGL